jgi:protein-disulfide isomerase
MPVTRSRAAVIVLAAAFAVACGRAGGPGAGRAGGKPPATLGPRDVVAEVEGAKITLEELDAHAAGQLQQLRDREYEVRKAALEELIDQRLVKRAAAARGISDTELMKQEVEDKVERPTAAEIHDVYERNRDRVGGRTEAEVRPQIESSLLDQRKAARARAFTTELRDNAQVKIALEQPRFDVVFPADAQAMGPKDAPVTIVEYTDYLCPYCQHAEEVVAKVLERHAGRIRFVHRDYLIGRPRSLPVARAALCAADQGKFWEYRRDLLTRQGDWSDQDLESRAARLGARPEEFRSCLASDRHDQAILASADEGQKAGVTGTPTYFVNGRRMTGLRSEADFDEAILAELGRRG